MSCLHLPQGKSDASPGCLELSGSVLFVVLPSFVSQLTVLKTFVFGPFHVSCTGCWLSCTIKCFIWSLDLTSFNISVNQNFRLSFPWLHIGICSVDKLILFYAEIVTLWDLDSTYWALCVCWFFSPWQLFCPWCGGAGEHLETPKLVTPPRALVFYSELI